MTNAELIDAMAGLRQLAQMTLPIGGSLRVRKLVRQVQEVAGDVEAERQKLLERYALRGDDGEILFSDEQCTQVRVNAAFEPAYQELMSLPCENGFEPLRASNLGEIQIAPVVLLLLGDLLDDEV